MSEVNSEKLASRAYQWIRRHPVWVAVVLLFITYFLTRLLCLGRLPIFFDESIFIRWSQKVLKEGDFLISLTDGKLPLHRWAMAPFLAIVGDPLIAGRLASVAFGAITTGGILLIGREIGDWKLGILSGFLYVICPFTLWFDRVAMTESLLLALFVITILLALKAVRSLSFWYIPAIGLSISLAMLTKGTAQLLFVILPFAYLARTRSMKKKRRPLLRWSAIVLSSLVIAYGIFSLLRLSDLYPRIAVRNAVATKTLIEVLKNPFDVFFSNVVTIFSTLVTFMTPVLLVVALLGLILGFMRKWRPAYFLVAWLVLTWLIEALVAKHWMFDTILPRFYLVLLPPLLLGAGYGCVEAMRAITGWTQVSRTRRGVAAVAAVIALVALPLVSISLVVVSPEIAILPQWTRFQYITDWPSGEGIEQVVAFLEEKSADGEIAVGSNMPGIGLPTSGLEIYLSDNENLRIITFKPDVKELPEELIDSSRDRPTYLVFNMFSEKNVPPGDWPVRTLRKYPKDGSDTMYLWLLEVESGLLPRHSSYFRQ